MHPALILWDMLLLAVEILFEPSGLAAMVAIVLVFAGVRARLGPARLFQLALLFSLCTGVFILSQVSVSAWGAGLMLYLIPAQLAIWGAWIIVSIGSVGLALGRQA